MTNSKYIAGLIGPTLVVLTTSEAINFHIWENNVPQVIYLNGIILFVVGISIVRVHNLWTFSWPVLINLIGWIAIFGGLYRVFAPEAPQAAQNMGTYIGLTAGGIIGVFLTFKAYSPENKR